MLKSGNVCTVLQLKLALDGSHNVEVALSENEFDTPGLDHFLYIH